MTPPRVIFFLFITVISTVAAAVVVVGQEFPAPTPYPVDRYEAGWNTNPFTLKTAAVATQKESFAKDLVLGSMYQVGLETTVVLVNAKTRERIRIVSTQADPNGMRIKSANILNSRRDSYAEIEKDGEIAILRYDDRLQKQLAAQNQVASNDPNGNGNPNAAAMNEAAAAAAARGQPVQKPPGAMGNNSANPNPNPNADITPLPGRNTPPQRRRLLTAPRSAPAPRPAPAPMPPPPSQ
ncbi:hypothetical protein FEM03_13090 [Phragmitibacter flavus]|uniref:Uncharacterized protein n=1 Tax=Phragmitibacter flavus TaxID=2576071 RepID=A0A5R8KD05_9BACT|nr:hypothetical protein [Phragmitibacter flavus]TLD70127.1 hypothetical protein FEM03_13090 [Phragmitibacter flavus]